MAEIRVEPKNNNNRSIWPWILGALLLIGLVWGVAELLEDDEREIEATRTEQTIIDNGEARPAGTQPVNNDRFEEDRLEDDNLRTNDRMENDRTLEEDPILENDTEIRNDRVRDDGVLENR